MAYILSSILQRNCSIVYWGHGEYKKAIAPSQAIALDSFFKLKYWHKVNFLFYILFINFNN
ncbi:MAG: hypothetical protein ACRC80_13855 [Waterburya sp.]